MANPNTAVFPAATATDADLLVHSNNAQTTLNGTIDASTLTIVLTDATAFVVPCILTIGSERIHIESKLSNTMTASAAGRGFDSSTAASHISGVAVYGYLTRYEHNQLAAEVKAIEGAIRSGPHTLKTVAKTSAYTAATESVILVDATSGAVVITLPAAAGVTNRIYQVKKVDSSVNAVTVDGNDAETIDGATTQVLSTQYEAVMIVCDGAGWHIL
jgi:hypothetical protein